MTSTWNEALHPPEDSISQAMAHLEISTIDCNAFLLDIDGVLCESQQPVSRAMRNALNRLVEYYPVYIVTGNSFTKARDLLCDIEVDGIFCNNADEYRDFSGRLVWGEQIIRPLPPQIENTLQTLLGSDNSHAGNRIAWRTPRMINFSKCGRFASKETRASCDVSWREDTIKLIELIYPEVRAVIGGAVSIDIFMRGADKSRAGAYLTNFLNRHFIFIGDKTSPGGNDYPLKEYCIKYPENLCLTSSGPEHTLELIDKITGGK